MRAGKLFEVFRELGPVNGIFYAVDRGLVRLGGKCRIFRYYYVAQPVPAGSLIPLSLASGASVRRIGTGEAALRAMPLTAEKSAYRFDQSAVCFGAFSRERLVAYLWLCFGPYLEDEVRCRFVPLPQGRTCWDFDVYVFPENRGGLAFARLWDGVNGYLRERGIEWTMSRISAFNRQSVQSHQRLGTRRLGSAIFVRCGRLQLMAGSLRPYLHLSIGPNSLPEIRIQAPR